MENKLYCSSCGAPLIEGGRFCIKCGDEVYKKPPSEECDGCGSQLPEEADYCYSCGKKRRIMRFFYPKHCTNCGVSMKNEEFAFCSVCGVRVELEPREVTPKIEKSKSEDCVGGFIGNIVKKSMLAVISMILCVLAFLPVFSLKFDAAELVGTDDVELEISFGIGSTQAVVLFFDSLKDLEQEELMDTDLADKLEDIVGDMSLSPDEDELSACANDIIWIILRMAMQSEEVQFSSFYLICALLGALYIALAIACAVVSCVDLLMYAVKKSSSVGHITISLLSLKIPFSLLFAAAIYNSYGFGSVASIADEVNGTVSFYGILSTVLPLTALTYVGIYRCVCGEKKKLSTKRIVSRCIAITLSFVVMISMFLPFVNVKVEAKGGYDATTAVGLEFLASAAISDIQLDELENAHDAIDNDKNAAGDKVKDSETVVNELAESLTAYTKRDIKNGQGNDICAEMAIWLFGGFGAAKYLKTISFGVTASIIVCICAKLILWQYIYCTVMGRSMKSGIVTVAKGVAIVALAVLAAALIVYTVLVNSNADILEIAYSMKLNSALYILAIAVIGSAFVPASASSYSENYSDR